MKLPNFKRVPSRPGRRPQGIALVVTLIMLAIITFMAITFLVISRSERSSVATATEQTQARLAADTALERAKIDVVAPMMGWGNRFGYELLVSTNFINPLGYQAGNTSYTNVNYVYPNGTLLAGATPDYYQNLANLFISPRPPVYITDPLRPGVVDFRYYLDLNRNGRHDPSGWQVETNWQNEPILDVDGQPIFTYLMGDPEFIGQLEFPDQPHSATNRFLSRFAYMVAPVGKTLDLNRVHNYAKLLDPTTMAFGLGDGFFRNQGVGTWEINFAAFLADLNTNLWPFPVANPGIGNPYYYDLDLAKGSTGAAFDDALGLMRFRYAGNPQGNLFSVLDMFGQRGGQAFSSDFTDGYSRGPLMTGNYWYPPANQDADITRVNLVWSGAPNPNQYFSHQELFNPGRISPSFVAKLDMASTNNSTYDRYTFYRFLSQMGTDSAPESPSKVHINYIDINGFQATNFVPWHSPDVKVILGRPGSEVFFTNAVDKLLRAEGFDKFTTQGIPVFTNGVFCYTPSVNRLLQLAANIFDATTNRTFTGASVHPYLPTVFQPVFGNSNGNIFITDFREVDQVAELAASRLVDLSNTNIAANVQPLDRIFGVPLIIGAKKGHPNFNEFSLQMEFHVTRKMEISKSSPTAKDYTTNVMYVVGVSNALGIEAWNSYLTNYTRPVDVYATNFITMALTNDYGFRYAPVILPIGRFTNINVWPGYKAANVAQEPSLMVPFQTNYAFLPDALYIYPNLINTNLTAGFQRGVGFPLPRWGLAVTNRVLFMIVDRQSQRLIDYVQLGGLQSDLDLASLIATTGRGFDGMWNTNRPGAGAQNDITRPFVGAIYQVGVSMGDYGSPSTEWNDYGANQFSGVQKLQEMDKFRTFFGLTPNYFPNTPRNTNLVTQVPFSPTKRVSQYLSWQANDPLVHYTAGDLYYVAAGAGITLPKPNEKIQMLKNMGVVNVKYNPWGGNPRAGEEADIENSFRLALKDPLVTRSDDWDFPTNKFPTAGMLGRVHRGTPWQTVYLKSSNVVSTVKELENWKRWTGNGNDIDAKRTAPVNDRKLLEIFTAAITPEATRGQLDVNQNGLAAWSAALSGVVALEGDTNAISASQRSTNNYPYVIIQPAGTDGTNAPVGHLVQVMNDYRRTNYAGSFKHLGDVLSVPELTERSPWLGLANMGTEQMKWGISDAVYERIPQQILGLLKIENTPRFVVYSYGQTLKPANRSVVMSGPYAGMCTNYQITAEVATRAVVRIEGAPNNPRAVVESYNVLPPD